MIPLRISSGQNTEGTKNCDVVVDIIFDINLLWLCAERELTPKSMADPPVGVPEAVPTNTQETTNLFSSSDFQPSIVPRKRRQLLHGDKITSAPRSNPEFAVTDEHTGRVTTKEVRQLIDSLKDIIHHQTTLIQATKNELQELKHDQNVLQAQIEKLHEEIRALRGQVETPPSTPPTRS